jgi:hypothetical protein
MVHAAFVRSAHAHARLTRVNLDRARRAPGVVGVLGATPVARLCKPYRDVLLHYKGMKTGAMLPLAVERVRYVGEPTCPGRSTTSGLRPPCASSTGQGRLVGRAAGARPWDSPKGRQFIEALLTTPASP